MLVRQSGGESGASGWQARTSVIFMALSIHPSVLVLPSPGKRQSGKMLSYERPFLDPVLDLLGRHRGLALPGRAADLAGHAAVRPEATTAAPFHLLVEHAVPALPARLPDSCRRPRQDRARRRLRDGGQSSVTDRHH